MSEEYTTTTAVPGPIVSMKDIEDLIARVTSDMRKMVHTMSVNFESTKTTEILATLAVKHGEPLTNEGAYVMLSGIPIYHNPVIADGIVVLKDAAGEVIGWCDLAAFIPTIEVK